MNIKKIKKIIEQGENIRTEFKECYDDLPKNIYETVCAFSNRNGGNILLGVKDNKEIQGINETKIENIKNSFITTINNSTKLNPPLYLSINQLKINNKIILHIYVPISSQVQKCNNRIFYRNEDGDIDITNNHTQLTQIYLNKQTTYNENKIYPYCTLKDLDENTIKKAKKLIISQNNTHPWKKMTNLELFKSAKLYLKDFQTNKKGFTLAAILLFGKEETISSILPHYKTDLILRKNNLYRYDDRDDVRLNLINSYERIMNFGKKHLPDPFHLEGTQRVNLRDKILREVASNILIHREFISAFPAKFIIENNQIRTENGNKPHSYGEIDPNNFSPYPKNPTIARFFKEIGYADELGSGIRNLNKYGKIYSGHKPSLIEDDIFKIVVPLNKNFTPHDTPQVTPHDTPHDILHDYINDLPTNYTKIILNFCIKEKTREEIQKHINIKDRKHFRESILAPLLKKDLIKFTIADKPRSKFQKYITSAKGLSCLNKKH